MSSNVCIVALESYRAETRFVLQRRKNGSMMMSDYDSGE
jgi:hypothetical protein